MWGWILFAILLAVTLMARLPDILIALRGDTRFVVKTGERTPLTLDRRGDDSIDVSTRIPIVNAGNQCGTLMDCFCRPLLPYEQYDGVAVRGKMEREGAAREDDYFEAIPLDKGKGFNLVLRLTLTARHGAGIAEALAGMVDVPVDIVTTEITRRPWKLEKWHLLLTAGELAGAIGVNVVDRDHVKGSAALSTAHD